MLKTNSHRMENIGHRSIASHISDPNQVFIQSVKHLKDTVHQSCYTCILRRYQNRNTVYGSHTPQTMLLLNVNKITYRD